MSYNPLNNPKGCEPRMCEFTALFTASSVFHSTSTHFHVMMLINLIIAQLLYRHINLLPQISNGLPISSRQFKFLSLVVKAVQHLTPTCFSRLLSLATPSCPKFISLCSKQTRPFTALFSPPYTSGIMTLLLLFPHLKCPCP